MPEQVGIRYYQIILNLLSLVILVSLVSLVILVSLVSVLVWAKLDGRNI